MDNRLQQATTGSFKKSTKDQVKAESKNAWSNELFVERGG